MITTRTTSTYIEVQAPDTVVGKLSRVRAARELVRAELGVARALDWQVVMDDGTTVRVRVSTETEHFQTAMDKRNAAPTRPEQVR